MTGGECRFANGPFAGRELRVAWSEMPPEWAGTRADTGRDFPLLVKFIFPDEKLSVQVHPGDEYAAAHELACRWTREDGNVVRHARAGRGGSARWFEAQRDAREFCSARSQTVRRKIA